MSYLMMDYEVESLPEQVSVPAGRDGVAIVLRRNRIAVGFAMCKSDENGSVLLRDLRVENLPAIEARAIKTPPPAVRQITIAVCTYNRPSTLARCIEALLNVNRLGIELELLVIGNAPPDNRTFETASRFPQVKYFMEPKRGLSNARNCAIKAATGDVIAFIDDDAVPDEDWVQGIQTAFRQNPHAMAVSGPIMPFELETEAQIIYQGRGGHCRGCDKIVFASTLPGSPTYPCGEASFGAGANMAFRRELFDQIGLFDPLLSTATVVVDDLDIFYRTIRAGIIWAYEPQMLIFHHDRREMSSLQTQAYNWSCGNVAYMMKSFHTDPEYRYKIVRFLTRLMARKAGGVLASALGRRAYRWPVSLAWAEFTGAIAGFTAYKRQFEGQKL